MFPLSLAWEIQVSCLIREGKASVAYAFLLLLKRYHLQIVYEICLFNFDLDTFLRTKPLPRNLFLNKVAKKY